VLVLVPVMMLVLALMLVVLLVVLVMVNTCGLTLRMRFPAMEARLSQLSWLCDS
jgi:hypothetical protein